MTEHIYIALLSGIIFFILKLILNKKNKGTTDKGTTDKVTTEKDIMRDSVYVTIIVGLVLFAKDAYFNKAHVKTQVFTNEPAF
jgi:hypothetical protein